MKIQGIEVKISKDGLDDFETTEAMAVLNDEDATDAERVVAVGKLPRLIFGSQWTRIKRDLRAANDGKLTNEAVSMFIAEAINAVGALKN